MAERSVYALINGRIKVSPDYTYDLTGAKYLDTGVNLAKTDIMQQLRW